MKTLSKTIFFASLLSLSTAQAAEVSTAGQALTLCKAQAEEAHAGYKRSVSKKIKQTRTGFKLKMKVMTEEGSVSTKCEVARDGEVVYSKT